MHFLQPVPLRVSQILSTTCIGTHKSHMHQISHSSTSSGDPHHMYTSHPHLDCAYHPPMGMVHYPQNFNHTHQIIFKVLSTFLVCLFIFSKIFLFFYLFFTYWHTNTFLHNTHKFLILGLKYLFIYPLLFHLWLL